MIRSTKYKSDTTMDQRIEYFFIDVKETCNFNSILFDYSPSETGVTVRGTLTLEDYHIDEPKLALKIVNTYTRELYKGISPDEVKDNLIRHQQDLSDIFIRSTEGRVLGRLYDLSHCREVVDLTRKEVKQWPVVEKDWCPNRFWDYCQSYYTDYLNFMRLQNMKAKEESQKYLGKIVKVLVEGPSKKNPEMLTGRSSTHKIVLFKSDRKDLKGKFVNTRIYDAKTWTLYGELVEE